VQLIKVGELNAYDILCNDWIVFEQGLLPTAAVAVVEPDSEPDTEVVAVHGEDPAEGARDVADDTPEPETGTEATAAGSDHEEDES
jgi:large subunit ribosomal protein L4